MRYLIFLFLVKSLPAFSQQNPMPELTKNDRILILAPHPDDETIATGGIIQRAQKAGAKIKVMYFTNGDHNEWAFIVYKKRPIVREKTFVKMGEIRRKETIKAMNYLGLNDTDLIFLGYPDHGTLGLLTTYWDANKPFKDALTKLSAVPYPECLSFSAPYIGESVLKDMETILLKFNPTKIYVSHFGDLNVDHQALFLFLQIALWNLKDRINKPVFFLYPVHILKWPEKEGFHPNLTLEPPAKFKDSKFLWQTMELSKEEIVAKHHAISFYKSQIEYKPHYLNSFVRENELFSDYFIINLTKQDTANIRWEDIAVLAEEDTIYNESQMVHLAYAETNKNLLIRVGLKRKIDEYFGVSSIILGYSDKKNFSAMPKIYIHIGINGVHLKNGEEVLPSKDILVKYEERSLIITVPLSLLENPDYIMSSVKTTTRDIPSEDNIWRIIKL